jgi:hypothetical protein
VNGTQRQPGDRAAAGDGQAAASPETPAGRRCSREQPPMAAAVRRTGPPWPGIGLVVATASTSCLIGGPGRPPGTMTGRPAA